MLLKTSLQFHRGGVVRSSLTVGELNVTMLTFETSATILHTLAVAFGGARQALWLTLLTSEEMKCQVFDTSQGSSHN